MQGLELTGSTYYDYWIRDELGFGAGGWVRMRLSACGLREPSIIWLLPGQEVTCGICNFPGTLSRVSIGSPNVVGAHDAASSTIWG